MVKYQELTEVRVTKDRNKHRFTIPTNEIKRIGAKTNDFIKINLKKNNQPITFYSKIPKAPKSRTNLQIKRTIPKRFLEQTKLKEKDLIEIKISLVSNKRSKLLIKNNHFDLLAFIPEKTKENKPIMVELFKKNNEEHCKIWCCSGQGGKVKNLELKRNIKIDQELGEFFGLMQAESSKKGKKFDFTNNFLSEIKLFMKVSEKFGIKNKSWKFTLFHNPKLNSKEINIQLNIFKRMFNTVNQTISVVKNKNLIKFTYNCHVNSILLNEIMNSLLIKIRKLLADSTNKKLTNFAKGFILKDLLGDGTVVTNKHSLDIVISEVDILSQEDIVKILKNYFNIKASLQGIKINLSTGFNEYLWMLKNKAFIGHLRNRQKLISYIKSNYYINCLYQRLNNLENGFTNEFAKKHSISNKAAEAYLRSNMKRGYLVRSKQKRIAKYTISKKGKEFLNLMTSL